MLSGRRVCSRPLSGCRVRTRSPSGRGIVTRILSRRSIGPRSPSGHGIGSGFFGRGIATCLSSPGICSRTSFGRGIGSRIPSARRGRLPRIRMLSGRGLGLVFSRGFPARRGRLPRCRMISGCGGRLRRCRSFSGRRGRLLRSCGRCSGLLLRLRQLFRGALTRPSAPARAASGTRSASLLGRIGRGSRIGTHCGTCGTNPGNPRDLGDPCPCTRYATLFRLIPCGFRCFSGRLFRLRPSDVLRCLSGRPFRTALCRACRSIPGRLFVRAACGVPRRFSGRTIGPALCIGTRPGRRFPSAPGSVLRPCDIPGRFFGCGIRRHSLPCGGRRRLRGALFGRFRSCLTRYFFIFHR